MSEINQNYDCFPDCWEYNEPYALQLFMKKATKLLNETGSLEELRMGDTSFYFIEIDITPLKIGSKLYVTALEGEGYSILHSDNTVVVQIKTARTAVVDEEEEELEEGAEGTTEGGDAPTEETQE